MNKVKIINLKRKNIIKEMSNIGLYVISAVIFCFLTIDSFFTTASTSYYSEQTIYAKDNIIISIVVLLLFSCFIILGKKILKSYKIKSKKMIIIFLLIINILIGYKWISSADIKMVDDRKFVYESAVKMYNGDYSPLYLPDNFNGYGSFDKGGYLYLWPHQTGLVFFIELLYVVFKDNTIFVFQIINLLFLNFSFYIMAKIPKRFFGIKNNDILSIILSIMCLPALLYCTFVYGNLISFGLSVISIYIWKMFVDEKGRKKKRILLIYSILSIALAYQIKITALIVVIALIILNLLYLIDKKDKSCILYIIILVLFYSVPMTLTQKFYELRSGVSISDGISKLGWIETGLSDNGFSPGWYNYWPAYGIVEAGLDNDVYKELSKEHIVKRLEYFRNDKFGMIKFFYKKNSSAWNNPSYQALWVQKEIKNTEFNRNVIFGDIGKFLDKYFNYIQLIIYVGGLLSLIICYKEFNYFKASYLLVIIGGFIFYTFWETKAQYTLQYYLMMIPYASIGWNKITDVIIKKYK